MAVVIEAPPVEDVDLTPKIDDTVRALLGDSYPDDVLLLYLPQRVCHAFYVIDPDDNPQQNRFHWMVAFITQENAAQWAAGMARVFRVGNQWHRERVEVHHHPLQEACELAQRLYPALRGLMIVHPSGRHVRHYIR